MCALPILLLAVAVAAPTSAFAGDPGARRGFSFAVERITVGGEAPAAFVGDASGAQIERAADDSIAAIEGDLAASGSLRGGPFLPVGTSAGTFRVESAPGADLRVAPASLVLATSGGSLSATPTGVYGTRAVDPLTSRPRSGPDGFLLGSENAFAALCDWTAGTNRWDPRVCQLDAFNSLVALPPVFPPNYADRAHGGKTVGALSSLYANVLAGSAVAAGVIRNFFTFNVAVPLVALSADSCDSFESGENGCTDAPDSGPTTAFAAGPTSSLNETLTDAQESMLGCGFFWGTSLDSDCEFDGMRLLRAEAGALVEAMVRPNDWLATNGLPQPGTAGFSGESACERETEGGLVRLPGCRGPADEGYDPRIDGCTGPGPFGCNAGDDGRAADAPVLAIPSVFGASAGQAFRSELSALSWNLTMMLVAFSRRATDAAAPDEFDPLDPYSIAPGRCSFAQPQHCYATAALRTERALDDDPSSAPKRRWSWESGAAWEIGDATGDLAPFAGGTLYQFGPVASSSGAEASLGFLLVPEPERAALGGVAGLVLLAFVAARSRAGKVKQRPR